MVPAGDFPAFPLPGWPLPAGTAVTITTLNVYGADSKKILEQLHALGAKVGKLSLDFDQAVERLTEKLSSLTSVGDAIETVVKDLVQQVRTMAKEGASAAQLNKWSDTIDAEVAQIRASALEGTQVVDPPVDEPPDEPPTDPNPSFGKKR